MTRSTTLLRRVLGAAAATTLAIGIASAPATAQAPPPDPGDVERLDLLVVDTTGRALDSGGSLTQFRVELEGEDECPGDSAHDQFRIDSYIVPVDVDPSQLLYTAFGPTPLEFSEYEGFQMPLYKLSGDPFAAEFTAQQIEPGAPGPIRELPSFDFGVYVPTPGIDGYDGGLPSGEYRLGLACTYAGRVTNLWETTIELTQDPSDEPVGIKWTVTGPQPGALESSPSDPSTVVYVLVAVAAVMAVVAVALHRSSRRSVRLSDTVTAEESVV